MIGPRRLLGWALVPTLAVAASIGTLVLVRQAIGDGNGNLADSMSQAQVRAAYASAAHATPSRPPTAAGGPSPIATSTASPTHRPANSSPTHPTTGSTPTPHSTGSGGPPSAHHPSPSPTSHPSSPPPTSVTRVLTSSGGSVVVRCTGGAARASVYLVSWSPAQGYRVADVARGPGEEAEIEFESDQSSVPVRYQCTASGPVQQVGGGSSGGYDDGTGTGHDG